MKKLKNTLLFAFVALLGGVCGGLLAQGQNPLDAAGNGLKFTDEEMAYIRQIGGASVQGGSEADVRLTGLLSKAVGDERLTLAVAKTAITADERARKYDTILGAMTVLQQQEMLRQNQQIILLLERLAKK